MLSYVPMNAFWSILFEKKIYKKIKNSRCFSLSVDSMVGSRPDSMGHDTYEILAESPENRQFIINPHRFHGFQRPDLAIDLKSRGKSNGWRAAATRELFCIKLFSTPKNTKTWRFILNSDSWWALSILLRKIAKLSKFWPPNPISARIAWIGLTLLRVRPQIWFWNRFTEFRRLPRTFSDKTIQSWNFRIFLIFITKRRNLGTLSKIHVAAHEPHEIDLRSPRRSCICHFDRLFRTENGTYIAFWSSLGTFMHFWINLELFIFQ